ncbi:hypothetical protein QBC33DRAFT_574124 [Phialemonium atrogriseum]|uniref:Protein kinase domain-containing protein n=1 Tax=Phialemonium atrogriseum TaxID=1093897 RepID=A0AAJ0FCV2_9PEZI|nr:uncharacterized protein QBC33DRAFT_574124 [Phialemonium atrogriseum]KAK1762507.1 hypothetical protein QBC33DRAFT_574124 [Phialemonium atrogriseum]
MAQLDRRSVALRAQELIEDDIHEARDQVRPCNEAGHGFTDFAYPFDNPIFYIKFGNRSIASMTAEARTHQFSFDALENTPLERRNDIRIPQICRILYTPRGAYIVMEYVQGKTLGQLYQKIERFEENSKPYYDKIARGIKLPLSIPVPTDAKPGPCGGGIIKHPLFKDGEALIRYDSIGNLATWFIKTNPKVTLERKLAYTLISTKETFMFIDAGDLYILDFEHVAFLPISFQDFAFRSPFMMSSLVAPRIQDQFDLPQNNFMVTERFLD